MARRQCTATAANGAPCKRQPSRGENVCLFHDPSAKAKAKHTAASARGGSHPKNALPFVPALTEDPRIATLNLETAGGLRGLLGATLGALAQLPMDARTANAIGQLATAQRGLIEASDLERRIADIEVAQRSARA